MGMGLIEWTTTRMKANDIERRVGSVGFISMSMIYPVTPFQSAISNRSNTKHPRKDQRWNDLSNWWTEYITSCCWREMYLQMSLSSPQLESNQTGTCFYSPTLIKPLTARLTSTVQAHSWIFCSGRAAVV